MPAIDPATLALRLLAVILGAGGIAWATLIAKSWYDARKLRLDAKTQSDRNVLDKDAQKLKAAADERDDRRDDFKETVAALTGNIRSLQEQLKQQQDSARETAAGLQQQITAQGQEINTQRGEIRSLQEQVDAMREERITLLSQISALEMAKGAEKLRADQAEKHMVELNEVICGLREEIVRKDRAIRDLKADLRRAKGEKSDKVERATADAPGGTA